MNTNTLFSTSISRRTIIKYALGTTAAVAVGGVALASEASARSGGALRTTTSLNFRSQPNTSSKVLAVLSKGTVVGYLGERKNGFLAVSHNGQSGWAYESYLEWVDDTNPDPVIIGTAIVAASANFRSGPSTSHQVLHVLAKGTEVQITDTVQNGYRYAVVGGQAGWIYDSLLAPAGGEGPGVFFTTAAVNLRSKPSTSSSVITVVPAGAKVLDYDFVMSNGFRGVDYNNGTVGWIYDAYLTQ
jgi:N-acetylmuramoyl-L-alanine amidase